MENLDIIGLIGTVLGLFATVLSWLITAVKRSKNNKETKVMDKLYSWCIDAEQTFNSIPESGKLKLNQVMSNALRFCFQNKIKYNEEKIKLGIEKIIESSKFINSKKGIEKDKVEIDTEKVFCNNEQTNSNNNENNNANQVSERGDIQ